MDYLSSNSGMDNVIHACQWMSSVWSKDTAELSS